MVKDKKILKSSIIEGFGTLIVREFFIKIFSFCGQIFLARLLIPADFGIYVIIVFVISIFSLFTDIGLSLAIIQKHKDVTKKELSSIFLLKLSLSLLMIALVFISAPLLKYFYPTFSDMNVLMIRVFSISLLTSSLRSIPVSILERKIKYNLISVIDIFGVFIYYTASVVGAFVGWGVWSFILGALTKEIIETLIVYYIEPFVPAFGFSLNSIKKMVKFGIFIQGNALVNVIEASITPVVAGKLTGINSVGLLDFAFGLASIPETIAFNFGRVAFAGYSRIQKEKELLFNSISKSISMLSILLYVFPVIMFGLGAELVPLVFSSKWVSAVPALYWYSACTLFLPLISPLGQGILVIGKSKEIFLTSIIIVIFGFLSTFWLVNMFGFVGISITYFLITLAFCFFYILIFRKANYYFPLISLVAPKLIVSVLSFGIITILNITLPHNVFFLLLKLGVGTAAYILLMFTLAREDSLEFLRLILGMIRSKIT